jgi:hypothetical protein
VALIKELEIAGIDLESLVVGTADEVAVADVVRPASSAVAFTGEGVAALESRVSIVWLVCAYVYSVVAVQLLTVTMSLQDRSR